jgi:hypothetical protein
MTRFPLPASRIPRFGDSNNLLAQHSLQARHVSADHAQTKWILERTRAGLKTEIESLPLQLGDARVDVRLAHLANVLS